MTKLEVVIAHCVIQVVIAVIQQLSVLAVFYAIYDNPMIGNIYIVIVLLIMLQIMGLFYGLWFYHFSILVGCDQRKIVGFIILLKFYYLVVLNINGLMYIYHFLLLPSFVYMFFKNSANLL